MAKKPKGKMGFWRRLAKKRYDGTTEIRNGRHLRNAIVDMGGTAYPTQQAISLLKRAGIPILKFDEMMAASDCEACVDY